jgi:hypothetical protein
MELLMSLLEIFGFIQELVGIMLVIFAVHRELQEVKVLKDLRGL